MGVGWLPGLEEHRFLSRRAIIAVALALAVVAGLTLPALLSSDQLMISEAWVRSTVENLGMAGPLVLIGLMVLAIVASPIPSGPIAVAAGALYGTLAGGCLVVTGAVLGAIAAFAIARYLGFDVVRRSSNPVLAYITAPRSQNSLMLIVFASRLVPFISFDAISYAAGLTCVSLGRFAIATFMGVVPVSFALAAMGAGMAEGGTDWILVVGLGGGLTLLPALGKCIWDRR